MTYGVPKMGCQKQENHYGAPTEVYLYFNYRSPGFVLLVELDEKPLLFKFEVNRLLLVKYCHLSCLADLFATKYHFAHAYYKFALFAL